MAEACAVLAEAGGGATVLAGGQTLMPLLNLRMSQPFIILDINKIAELKGISAGRRRRPASAPATRQCEVLENSQLLAAESAGAGARPCSHVGHHQTRNRGTVGGSVALGEPAAELPADCGGAWRDDRGSIHPRHPHRSPRASFYLGPYMNVLEPDELVTAIHFPGLANRAMSPCSAKSPSAPAILPWSA